MPDLSTQLREYFDATASPVEVEEVISDDPWVPSRRKPESKMGPTRGRAYGTAVVAAILVLILGAALLLPGENENRVADTTPSTGSESYFQGTWVATDADGSHPTATFEVSVDGVVEMVGVDDYASVCSGAPSTMTGTGRLDSDTVVVIPDPVLTCDDGTEPKALSGPSLQVQLQNLTFTFDPVTDALRDNLGGSWLREGAENPTPPPAVSTAMWPQSDLEEAQEAQELADAGDPVYTWQVDVGLAEEDGTWDRLYNGQVELVDRFLREVLGWEAYLQNLHEGSGDSSLNDQRFLRCAPDRTNPLYPPQPGSEVGGESCAPTVDDLTYESVSFDLVQPVRQGSDGIWVVSNWRPRRFVQVDPVVAEAQATERLEQFLEARVAGNGAEGYVNVYAGWLGHEFPLLYATTSGARYERFEFERVSEPTWPYGGYIGFETRLFAEDATVVEQEIYSHWDGGASVGIEGGLALGGMTLENGRPVPMVHAQFDGEVTYSSPSQNSFEVLDDHSTLIDFTDPAIYWSECRQGPVPADAAAFAQAVTGDPNFETTAPISARIGGVEAVAMDVALSPSGQVCPAFRTDTRRWIHSLWEPGKRQRLYLVDLPDGMSFETLAITVTVSEERFEEVIEAAQPIIDSIQFHTR